MARTSRERGGACPAGGRRSSCPRQIRSRHVVSRILPSMAASFVINDGEDCHYLRQPTLSLFFPLPIASQEDFHEVTEPPTPRNQRGLSERSSRRLRRPRARSHRPGRRKRCWQIDLDRLDLCRPLPPAAGAEAVAP